MPSSLRERATKKAKVAAEASIESPDSVRRENETAVSDSGVDSRSDEELTAEVRAGLDAYRRGMRDAIEGARRAGAALQVMKDRAGHGNWEAWLRDNFEMSPQTARLYMRIANNWDRVIEHGLDKIPDLTLSDLRSFLAEPKKETEEPQKEHKKEPELNVEDDEPQPSGEEDVGGGADGPPTDIRQRSVRLRDDVMDRFDYMVRRLTKVLSTDEHEVIYRGVRFLFEEKCRD
jgi:hypothetical protein